MIKYYSIIKWISALIFIAGVVLQLLGISIGRLIWVLILLIMFIYYPLVIERLQKQLKEKEKVE
jgi:hypothetical protein